MTASPAPTVYPSATTTGIFSRVDAAAYLQRIQLPHTLLNEPPSLPLLRQIQSSHILSVPFESTTLHVPDWTDDDAPITLGAGETVLLGEGAFNRIVKLNRGGYCFSLNSSFAMLLRTFGFKVSEVAAKVYGFQGQDPEVAGYRWAPTSHQCSVVDWEGSDGRFFVDVGFGSAQSAYPIPFADGAEVESIYPGDVFQIRQGPLPGVNVIDPLPSWTIYHRCTSPASGSYWSPVYSFILSTVSFADFVVYNHYNSTHPSAVFKTFFVTSQLRSNGERRTLYFNEGLEHEGKRCAKLQTSGGKLGHKPERDVRWVEMRVGPIRQVLQEEFGFIFPEGYAGN